MAMLESNECRCGHCSKCITLALSAPDPVFGPILSPQRETERLFNFQFAFSRLVVLLSWLRNRWCETINDNVSLLPDTVLAPSVLGFRSHMIVPIRFLVAVPKGRTEALRVFSGIIEDLKDRTIREIFDAHCMEAAAVAPARSRFLKKSAIRPLRRPWWWAMSAPGTLRRGRLVLFSAHEPTFAGWPKRESLTQS
jgi:hypothetical protein